MTENSGKHYTYNDSFIRIQMNSQIHWHLGWQNLEEPWAQSFHVLSKRATYPARQNVHELGRALSLTDII